MDLLPWLGIRQVNLDELIKMKGLSNSKYSDMTYQLLLASVEHHIWVSIRDTISPFILDSPSMNNKPSLVPTPSSIDKESPPVPTPSPIGNEPLLDPSLIDNAPSQVYIPSLIDEVPSPVSTPSHIGKKPPLVLSPRDTTTSAMPTPSTVNIEPSPMPTPKPRGKEPPLYSSPMDNEPSPLHILSPTNKRPSPVPTPSLSQASVAFDIIINIAGFVYVADLCNMISPDHILPYVYKGVYSVSVGFSKYHYMFLTKAEEHQCMGIIYPRTRKTYVHRTLPMGIRNYPGAPGRFGATCIRLVMDNSPLFGGTPVDNSLQQYFAKSVSPYALGRTSNYWD